MLYFLAIKETKELASSSPQKLTTVKLPKIEHSPGFLRYENLLGSSESMAHEAG